MPLPSDDYYAVLDIPTDATQQQIRDGYKKAALKYHPDRVPADSPTRPQRTKQFQLVNEAYYTLSDPSRRREYDLHRQTHMPEEEEDDGEPDVKPSHGGFSWSSMFGNRARTEREEEEFSEEQFGSVFEEMLREEGMAEGEGARPTKKFWSIVGGLSGGAMGFIVANFAGAVAGAVAGNRLGAVRDAKGKSVYEVFQELPQSEKTRLLSELAKKVLARTVSA